MVSFSFYDYLDTLERSLSQKQGEATANSLQEVQQLRSHTANVSAMQKHLKSYKTLKMLVDNYNLVFI